MAEKLTRVTLRERATHIHNGVELKPGDSVELNETQLKAFGDKFQLTAPAPAPPPEPPPANSTSGPADESATKTTLVTAGGPQVAPVSTAVLGTAPLGVKPGPVPGATTPVAGATTPVAGATTQTPGSQGEQK